MNAQPVLTALSSRSIAAWVRQAQRRVVYAAPGIHPQPAAALAELSSRLPLSSITVSLDFDEHTLRMGYGTLEAVEVLSAVGLKPTHSPGFRSGILIVDDRGWIFTPTALYLEAEPQSDETPNAVELSAAQVKALAIRLSPAAQKEAIEQAENPAEAQAIAQLTMELGVDAVAPAHMAAVKAAIEIAPPVKFDVARQVRVFEPYLQYVELSLTGAAVQRHRVRIPKSLQNLGTSKDLEGRLKTTFDLVEKGGALSSKSLEDDLNQIRKDLTPSLGKDHGRVVLKSAKSRLLERLAELRAKLEAHQAKVASELQKKLDDSRQQVVDYYLPRAKENKPDALVGSLLFVTDDDIRRWLEEELDNVFPSAKDLIHNMTLEDRYKDVTFETLNRPDFLESVQQAFPRINWDKAYTEFKAAGETGGNQQDEA